LTIVKLTEYHSVQPYLSQLSAVASRLHRLGWAPKNAGNFSIRLNRMLLTKVSGAPMWRIARNPRPYLCFVSLPPSGFHFRTVPAAVVPTSEIRVHIAVQRIIFQYSPQERVLLHTHPLELVKFTRCYSDHLKLNAFLNSNRALKKKQLTVTAIRRLPSGSRALALETARAFRKVELVIWPAHGVIASGKTVYAAFVKIRKLNSLFQRLLANAK
jgi:ribulose-5-phosphate 4-epimerase/fuculose-1-phosphate aldolase